MKANYHNEMYRYHEHVSWFGLDLPKVELSYPAQQNEPIRYDLDYLL